MRSCVAVLLLSLEWSRVLLCRTPPFLFSPWVLGAAPGGAPCVVDHAMVMPRGHSQRARGIGMNSQDLEDLWQKSYSVKGADLERFVKENAEEL